MSASRILLSAVLAAVFLSGCFWDDDDDGAMLDPQVTQTVGAAGGRVVSADGALELTIPAGALAAPTAITITEVAAANQSALVQAQRADRVYRLEPAGLQFAQPAAVRVELPPSADGEYAVALVHSEGVFEAPQSLALASSDTARSLTAELTHFSEILVFEEWGVHVEASVAPRSIKVGETLDAALSITGDGTGHEATILAEADYISTSNPADLVFVTENLADFHGANPPIKLPGDVVGASVASLQTWKCVRAHTGVMRFDISLEFPLPILDVNGNVIEMSTVTVSRTEPVEIDYVCEDETAPPPGGIRTGLTALPFGTAPDGVTLITGPFANVPASDAPYLGFALVDGFVVMDPKTGLSVLNMTFGSALGGLGTQNLGVEALTDSPGGPGADAALFAFNGREFYLRRWDTATGEWGFTEVGINTPVLDATHPPGEPDRLIFSALNYIGVIGPHPTQGFAQVPSETISQAQLGCSPSSAVQPFAGVGDVIATVCRSLAPGGPDQIGVVDRRGGTLWNPLFELDAGTAIRIRCTTDGIAAADSAVCGVTAGSTLHTFKLTLGSTWTPPARDEVPVGPGAVGVQFGLRANGLPRAVVGNFDDDSVNVVDFDAAGNRTANDRVAMPDGIDKTPHAAPFAFGGKNYIAVSGNATNNYVVLEKP